MRNRLYLCLRYIKSAPRLIWPLVVLTSACTARNQPMEAELFRKITPTSRPALQGSMAPSTSARSGGTK